MTGREERVTDQMVVFGLFVMVAAVLWVAYEAMAALIGIAFGV